MTESIQNKEEKERELDLGEIIEQAMDWLDFGPEVMTCCEPDGYFCDMEPEELELARGSIAYLGYRLLLMYRMKRSNAYKSPGGGVAFTHYNSEIRKDIASVLGIRGSEYDRIAEVKRLYKIADKAWDEDEKYRDKLDSIMQDFEERYDLDPKSLGIIFV